MPEISLVGNLGPNVGDEAVGKEISGKLISSTSYAEESSNLTSCISFRIWVNLLLEKVSQEYKKKRFATWVHLIIFLTRDQQSRERERREKRVKGGA